MEEGAGNVCVAIPREAGALARGNPSGCGELAWPPKRDESCLAPPIPTSGAETPFADVSDRPRDEVLSRVNTSLGADLAHVFLVRRAVIDGDIV